MSTSAKNRSIHKRDFIPARVRVNVSPGEMLRTLRELQGLSQQALAELTELSQSNVSALETGARMMGRERALIFARALRVHPAVILFPDFDLSMVA
jgi:transcriptional regulator with XRE-family HTH domain